MDSAVLSIAFWGLWRGRRRERDWQSAMREDAERKAASDPDSLSLTVEGLRSEIGDRLDFAVTIMREHGYRLVSVVPERSEVAWTALFERRRRL